MPRSTIIESLHADSSLGLHRTPLPSWEEGVEDKGGEVDAARKARVGAAIPSCEQLQMQAVRDRRTLHGQCGP